MKIFIAFVLILMIGCYDGTRVQQDVRIGYGNAYHFTESGMHYVLFDKSDSGSGVFVVNITKDSLEAEVLKQSLLNNQQ